MSQIALNGETLIADASGALLWPARETLVVADLHFEKGSRYAGEGHLLPPYDTAATLTLLTGVLRRTGARRVICLGDSFDDNDGPGRLAPADAAAIRALTAAHAWIWVSGNHDPDPPAALGGTASDHVEDGALAFRHRAAGDSNGHELSGHFHPKARVRLRTRNLTARCFVGDGNRLILPAFGAFTGGLNVLDPAIDGLFPDGFRAHVIGRKAIYRFDRASLLPGVTPIVDT